MENNLVLGNRDPTIELYFLNRSSGSIICSVTYEVILKPLKHVRQVGNKIKGGMYYFFQIYKPNLVEKISKNTHTHTNNKCEKICKK